MIVSWRFEISVSTIEENVIRNHVGALEDQQSQFVTTVAHHDRA